ncbi:hypothetical protein EMIHUDRAFT_249738 [Emiliania huxleyi CCMP1516]|uniref:Translation initiation factor eIF2B subunit beta n=2 Tax=Emiliania huxleyi TaxID=2903 RepID=A0A0D3I5Z5_EMIH1|nr:hypothetical protein EMIHUDRAFT_249738 [Emiliania huxleyi CCMP1516]EOD06680.1 hypothetical protein EMIHUDRAFT_249738 [Emiliania huxleyi CCMP1516]|eukprot:XP_005759109.1 hypothetical protein EMIHUDRAFT_249738 [Emiliania huxleyi CCMP1516]
MAAAATTRVGELPVVVQREISAFSARLRRQQKRTSADVARQALKIMREVVTHTAVRDVSWLISSIKLTGQLLIAAQPHELVIGNMVRRVLHIGPSLMKMLDAHTDVVSVVIITTRERDPTVETFLRAAHKKRPFEVVVAQTAHAPTYTTSSCQWRQ